MTIDITTRERDELIQRYYDGETLGREAEAAERLLETDPEARKMLSSLQSISKSISVDIAQALAGEDFSSYWASIEQRLPQTPPTWEPDGDIVVSRQAAPIEQPSVPWYRRLFSPGFGALALAALVAIAILPNLDPAPSPVDFEPVSYAVEIEEVESEGAMVIVQHATDTTPSIVSFTES
jgi:anti-sigma factor RsiW